MAMMGAINPQLESAPTGCQGLGFPDRLAVWHSCPAKMIAGLLENGVVIRWRVGCAAAWGLMRACLAFPASL